MNDRVLRIFSLTSMITINSTLVIGGIMEVIIIHTRSKEKEVEEVGDVSVYKVGEKERQSRTGAEHVVDRCPASMGYLLFFQAGLFPKNRA